MVRNAFCAEHDLQNDLQNSWAGGVCSLLSIQNQWQLKDAGTFFDALVVLMDWFNGGVRQLIGAMLHGKNVLLVSMRRTARSIFIAGDVALTIQDT